MPGNNSNEIGRRSFLRSAGALGLLAFAPRAAVQAVLQAAPKRGQNGRFLSAHELETLRALCHRLIPGPPDDPDPGALDAKAPEAIDMMLAAFEFDPPLIHAGAPFSNRAGARHNDMKNFVPLDRHAELGWRIRIEGSRGIKKREFAGPVRGLQQIYREGLRHLDDRAAPGFIDLPGPVQDAILSDFTDGQGQELVGAALAHTIEAVYGPPEYGGNHGLVGWKYTDWPGDVQPRGYTNRQVSERDAGATTLSFEDLPAIERFLPALLGRPASRDAWWLARNRFIRG